MGRKKKWPPERIDVTSKFSFSGMRMRKEYVINCFNPCLPLLDAGWSFLATRTLVGLRIALEGHQPTPGFPERHGHLSHLRCMLKE